MDCGGFRPLTGINFNNMKAYKGFSKDSFRPLTGINFNIKNKKNNPTGGRFPSPHGDKFQRSR